MHKKEIFHAIGTISILLSPISIVIVVTLLRDLLCSPGPTGNGCGYAGIGLTGYAIYIALAFAVIGITSMIISYSIKK
jgi:hypothetical protein